MVRCCLAALALALAATPAASAAADDGQIPDLVSALVVQAVTPGPAWWKVSRGNAVVWILGAPPYSSAALEWDKRAFEKRLTGAEYMIAPYYMTPQPYRTNSLGRRVMTDTFRKRGENMINLPAATRARMRAAMTRLGNLSDPLIADGSSIIYATRRLNQALIDRVPLTLESLRDQLEDPAKAAGVPVRRTMVNAIPDTNLYANGPVAPKIACLEATLAVAEKGPDPLRESLEAWARGDLPAAISTAGCVGAKGRVYRTEADQLVAQLETYLSKPGPPRKIVAAIELIPLLMKNGVIEWLKADGFTVEGPDSKEMDASD